MRVKLTNRSFMLYLLLAAVATTFIVLDGFLLVAAVAVVVLLGALLSDLLSLGRPSQFRAQLELPDQLELEQDCILKVTITRLRPTSWPLKVDLNLIPSDLLSINYIETRPVSSDLEIELATKARAEVLGRESFTEVEFALFSRFGFWKRTMLLPIVERTLQVVPPLMEMPRENFEKLTRSQRNMLAGSRVRLRQRQRDQFHSIREFRYPDSMKNIDAKKSQKYERLMVREYETVQRHHLFVAFDVGRAMFGAVRSNRKHDFYLSAAFWLIRYAIDRKDSVSFVSFCQREHLIIPKTHSLAPFRPLLNHDQALSPREEESDFQRLVAISNSQARQRSIVLIFTDASRPSTQETLLKSVKSLARKHLVVVVTLLDGAYSPQEQLLEFSEQQFTDEYYLRLQYGHSLEESFKHFQSGMNSLGAFALQIPEPHWMSTTCRVYDLLRSSLRA